MEYLTDIYRWDALLFGDIRPLDPPAPPDKFTVQHTIHLRPPAVSHQERDLVQQCFANAAGKIKFYLGHGGIHWITGLDKGKGEAYGVTSMVWDYTPGSGCDRDMSVYIMIDFREFQGLLRGGLNVCMYSSSQE
jgi:hypothetical protein